MVLSRCSLRLATLLRSSQCIHRLMPCRTLTAEEKYRMRYLRLTQAKDFKVPCHMSPRRTEYKCGQMEESKCELDMDEDPCGLDPLPLDLLHYKPSDKATRCYQRTWCECYPIPRPVRLPFDKVYPNRKRRDPKVIAKQHFTACNPDDIEEKPRVRAPIEKLIDVGSHPMPCCKMVLPGCQAVRKETSCALRRQPTCCEKRLTKYPSFSECKRDKLEPNLICECNKKLSVCEMWTYFRNKRS